MEKERILQIVREEKKKLGPQVFLRLVINKEMDYKGYIRSLPTKGLGFKEKVKLLRKMLKELSNMINQEVSGVCKNSDGVYTFYINPESLKSEKCFRRLCGHELYHIAAGHCDKKYSYFKNVIFDIPAMLYQYFGVRFYLKKFPKRLIK